MSARTFSADGRRSGSANRSAVFRSPKVTRGLRGLVIPALVIVLWEGLAWSGLMPLDTMSQPSAIVVAGWRAMLDGSLLIDTFNTFQTALTGLAVAAVVGATVGFSIGLSPTLEAVVGPTLEALRPIPAVALIPLALLLFGFGVRMEVMVVTFACVWPILIVTLAAVHGIEPRLLEVSRILEMAALPRIAKVVLPAALARIGVGVRVSAGIALVVAVTVEIVLNPRGLGFGMISAAQSLNPALMWAELLWVGIIGWGFNALLMGIERRWLGRYAAGGSR